ncbi:MAG: hypothetical protein V1668_03925 [Patescibacteria group bacterium]
MKTLETWQALLGLFAFAIVLAPVDLNPLMIWAPYREALNYLLNAYHGLFMAIYICAFCFILVVLVKPENAENRTA